MGRADNRAERVFLQRLESALDHCTMQLTPRASICAADISNYEYPVQCALTVTLLAADNELIDR